METPVNASLKEKFRIEIANLREMTFKRKLEHIWEYYKFHIISVLIILFVTLSLLNIWVFNPNPDTALFVSWNAGFATDEQIDSLVDVFEERLIEAGVREEVVVSQFFFNSDDPSVNMAGIQRTVAMISTGMIDLFVLDSQLLEDYSGIGYLQPLDSYLSVIESRDPVVYNRIEENIVSAMCEIDEDIIEERMVGIRIGSSPLFSKLGMFEQELYLSIAVTSGRTENVIQALIMFFE